MIHDESDPDRTGPKRQGLVFDLERLGRQKVSPTGKPLAMVLIAVVAIGAAIWQFASQGGPATAIHPTPTSPTPHAAPGATPPADRPAAPAPGPTPRPAPAEGPRTPDVVVTEPDSAPWLPVPVPGADLVVPEGIAPRTASSLRLSMNALRPDMPDLIAKDALLHLPEVVSQAGEDERARVRAYVLERLLPVTRRGTLGALAYDAAAALAEGDAAPLAPLVEQALGSGLTNDATADAAVFFLSHVPPASRDTAPALLETVVRDGSRPLHLRVRALEQLARWGAVSDDLRSWATAPTQETPLGEALSAPR